MPPMENLLTDEEAMKFARQLKGILNFPWDEEVVTAHAEHLKRWCTGAIVDGHRVWPPYSQADWLVTEAQRNGKSGRGPPHSKTSSMPSSRRDWALTNPSSRRRPA